MEIKKFEKQQQQKKKTKKRKKENGFLISPHPLTNFEI